MSANENIAKTMRRIQKEQHLSIAALAIKLGIAKSATVNYLKGIGNPRLDTAELLAKKCGVTLIELLSAHPPGWERAEITARAARLFASLPLEQRNKAVKLFLTLVDIFSEDGRT